MTCESVVRIAKPEDSLECWRLLKAAHEDNGLFPLAPQKVNYFLMRCIHPEIIAPDDTGPRGVIGVIGTPGHLEALSFMLIGGYWYTDIKTLEELLVFVDPNHRRSNHAKALISWMKYQSDITGLPLLTGIISNKRTEAKVRLYQRLLPTAGAFFLYNGKGSIHSSSAAYA